MIDASKLYLVWKIGVFSGLAMRVNIQDEGENRQILSFYDTNRDRRFTGQLIGENASGFSYRADDTGEHVFEVASIKTFDQVARPMIEGRTPTFHFEEDLHEFYRRRFL